MADPRFFDNRGPFPLEELAEKIGARLGRDADPAMLISDVAPIESASAGTMTYIDGGKGDLLAQCKASACIVHPRMEEMPAAPGLALLLAKEPRRAFALAAQAFYPRATASAGIAASARIDPSAMLDSSVEVGEHALIGPKAEIGARTRIGPGVVIGASVTIGRDGAIGPNASLSHCHVGDRVVIHAGARIGQDGFGIVPGVTHTWIPQLGRVIIQDDVEVGANSCIDRGSASDTVIGEGTCIDNLVQIGHNVRIGRYCVLAAQVGISGSVIVGDYVAIGGQAGFNDHIEIGDRAEIGAQSGVMRDVAAGERMMGYPAQPARRFFRMIAMLNRLTLGDRKDG